MRKSTLLKTMIGALMMTPAVANAQYITEAPAGGFDFSQGSDYVLIYAPEEQVEAIGDKMASNQNLNGETNNFDYWVADWDSKLLVIYNLENDAANSWGGEGKLNMTPLFEWGSGQFHANKANQYDLSMIDEDYYIHIGFMNIGAEDAANRYKFQIGENADNGFQLMVNLPVGEASDTYVGVGEAPKVNQWYYLDIPVKDLLDENGDFGFNFDPSKKLDVVFVCGFDKATCSVYETGNENASGLYDITIKTLGSALAIDGVFLYKKTGETAISSVKTAAGDIEAAYDLSGRRADMSRPGIYVVKTAQGARKVVVK